MPFYVSVEKKSAQKKMEELKKSGKFDRSFRVLEKDGKILVPVTGKIAGAFEFAGEKAVRKPRSIGEALATKLTEKELALLTDSFDLIGDIAIVEIPEALQNKEKEIADAIMRVHKNVRVVAKKEGPMEGVYRTRRLKIILGEKRTETVHIESGVRMLLDISKVYFSPRLSFERKRIAGQVKDGERILALFAGVGPFPLVIAKNKKNCRIAAIELNPIAVEYMKKNIALNKIKNMEAVEGDVSVLVPARYSDFADRILMPLPKDAEEFLPAAYEGAKDGAIIHFYTFAGIKNPFQEAHRKIYAHLKKEKVEIISERIVRPFSPALVQVVVDFMVRK